MYRLIIIDDDAGTSNNLGNYFPWEEHGFQVVEIGRASCRERV